MKDIKKIQEFFSKPLEEISTDSIGMKQQYILTEPVQIAYTDSFGTGMTGAVGVLHKANVGYFIGEEDAYIIILPGGTFYVSEDGEVAMKIYPIRDQSNEFGAALEKTPFAPKYEDWRDSLRKAPVKEADLNDPVAMKMRAAKDKLAKMRKANAGDDGNDKFFDNAKKIAFLKKEREQLMRDMEQEAEPEGGPIADEYGRKLNKIDAAIAKLSGRKEMDYDTAVGKVNEYDVYMPSQEEVDQFFQDNITLGTHYLNRRPVMGQEGSFNKTEIAPWDETDYSNWKTLVAKALKEEEGEDPIDTITMDVPLFIRVLEYAKEDAETDMDLHDLAEKAIATTKQQGMLSMDDYDMLVGELKQIGMEEAEGYSKFLKTDDNPEGKTDGLTTKAMNKILMNVIKDLKEGEPGLWDNIRAKKARGEKPSSKNSKAYKSAVAAGKRINKEK